MKEDFEEAMKKTKPSVHHDVISKYEHWNKLHGCTD
jgi:SpoVK/Ycf46/Vps4 family AAA+-type ATPase